MTIKTALSLPREQFTRLEHARKEMGISRSAFFQELVADYIRRSEEKKLIEQYVAGYKKKPEDLEELKALAYASAQAFGAEDLK